MSFLLLILITLVSSFFLLKLLKRGNGSKNLPKGSLGFPLIGETISFLQAQMKDKGDDWVQKRVIKYGSVFKTSLIGSPAVIIVGQAGNKFILGSDEDVLAAKQPVTLTAIAGDYAFSTLTGSRYKLIKAAIVSFLKPESIQNYVKQMDDLVTTMLLKETQKKGTIETVIFIKKLTFNIAFKILFGLQDEFTRDAFFDDFSIAFKAVWSLPLNFPGTIYWRGKRARSRIIRRIVPIMKRKKEDLLMGILSPTSDIISALLALEAKNGEMINEEGILDNFVMLTIAGHDTSASLMSMMVWKLSRDPEIYQKVLKEQMEILKDREGREEKNLTWADLQKMKFTWRVALELMRIAPPAFSISRRALKDTTFGGYHIPKGWQVFLITQGTHMEKEIFENPMEFDPSRFESSSKAIPPYTYIPFGAGLHTCIGKEFARVETLTTIHRLVTMYEWSQVHPDEAITRQFLPYPSMGLPIKIKPLIPS